MMTCKSCRKDETGMCDSCANEELKKLNATPEINVKPNELELLRAENLRLVAENARLISLAKGWAIAVDDCYFNETGDIYTDSIDACNEELSTITPATEAAIAEIKAQGVDDFVIYATASSFSDHDLTVEDAEEFAANLRAGRKG